jgi:type IV pilus assembly protein PilY1
VTNLTDQSSSTLNSLAGSGSGGWRILLDNATTNSCANGTCSKGGSFCSVDFDCLNFCAERIVTNSVATTSGVVFYTSFTPTADICSFGGNSYLWGVKYDTGAEPAGAALYGKAIIQMSTGTFAEQSFTDETKPIFTDRLNRRTDAPMFGKPPVDPPMVLNRGQNHPVKKILHAREK